jgi:predicted outer membrane repeat protein
VESLEDRRVLTSYIVDTPIDNPLAGPTERDGLVSLREAMKAASTNVRFGDALAGQDGGVVDSIKFAESLAGTTITLDGEELVISDNLKVIGLGSDQLTISGRNNNRIFNIHEDAIAELTDLTLADGYESEGGAMYNQGQLELSRVVLENNEADDAGGALYNSGGTATLNAVTFNSNVSYYQGGAIWSDHHLLVSQSVFDDNYADWEGGAIWSSSLLEVGQKSVFSNNSAYWGGGGIANLEDGEVVISDSDFTDNAALVYGGAVYSYPGFGVSGPSGTLDVSGGFFSGNTAGSGAALYSDASGTIDASTFSANTARSFGGAMALRGGTLIMTDSTLADNRSGGDGGAIDNLFATVVLRNSTVNGNSARRDGGAIENFFATVELVNTTVSGNTAGRFGGAIDNYSGGTLKAANATVVLNRADADGDGSGIGGGVYNLDSSSIATLNNTLLAGNLVGTADVETPNDLAGEPVELASQHNLIGDSGTSGGLLDGENGNIVGNAGTGTIDIGTIIDTNLTNNGSLTQTHALLLGSPAVDGGANSLVTSSTDQTGFIRILDGNSDGLAIVDIGAVELRTTSGLFVYLEDQVKALGESDVLNTGQEVSLSRILTQARTQASNGNVAASAALLEAFIHRTEKLYESGVLSAQEYEALAGAVDILQGSA